MTILFTLMLGVWIGGAIPVAMILSDRLAGIEMPMTNTERIVAIILWPMSLLRIWVYIESDSDVNG